MSKKPLKPHPDRKLGANAAEDLICERCINEVIEVIRSSVVTNEKLNNRMRDEIDEVFARCQTYQSKVPLKTQKRESDERTSKTNENATTQLETDGAGRRYTIKELALRLQKLTILDARLKLNDIDRSKEFLLRRVALLQEKVNRAKEDTQARQNKINELKTSLHTLHQELFNQYNDRIARLRLEDATRVAKQAAAFQYSHYKVIRQVAFTKYDAWKSQRSGFTGSRVKLDFYGQPIIPLESFLLHNNKLIAINTFIENLIRFQILMVQLLESDGTQISLPFLDYLKTQLPDSSFFDQVQEKINFLVDDPYDSTIDSANADGNTDVPNGDASKEPATRPSMDKITVKDNKIQVPLSFKTANLQRRASVRLASSESPGAEKFYPEMFSATPEPNGVALNRIGLTEKIKTSAIQGKRMVIVPHKILTKPFTKLTLKEYLKFVLIIVKIVINFDMLLGQTVDKVTTPKKKKTRDLLLSTHEHLRTESDKAHPDALQCLDLRITLERLATMDHYFEHKLAARSYNVSETDTKSLYVASLLYSSDRISFNPSIDADSPTLPDSSKFTRGSSSRLKEFYSVYLSSNQKPKSFTMPATIMENQVYGAISEGVLENEEDAGKSSNEDINFSSYEGDQLGESDVEPFNIKEVMKLVHKLVANGKGRGRENGDAGDEAVKRATKTMMKTTQSQLTDWDVVSRLY